jgi:outer membrane protein insertion porin family
VSSIRSADELQDTGYQVRTNGGLHLIRTLFYILILLALSPAWSQTGPDETPRPADSGKPDHDEPRHSTEEPKKQSPFENVPEASPIPRAQQPKPAGKPQLEVLKPGAPRSAPSGDVIVSIEFRGARRVPQETLRALISTKKGDIFNQDALHRDFMALWNTGRFDDVRLETETDKTGLIVRFVVTERPIVRTIASRSGRSGCPSNRNTTRTRCDGRRSC